MAKSKYRSQEEKSASLIDVVVLEERIKFEDGFGWVEHVHRPEAAQRLLSQHPKRFRVKDAN